MLVHAAVSRQARLRPAATAIIDGDDRIDYHTLDRAADFYAGVLHAAGVRPGTVVPVVLPRTPRLIAVLLAVLKCGAAYAALDPRWPRDRIDQIINLIGPDVVVNPHLAPAESLARAAARRATPMAAPVTDGDTATVFFTSGTTGTPKGVLSPHRATTRLFPRLGPVDLGPGRTVLQAAPVSWDAFSLETWGPLTSGGTCVMAGPDHLLPDDLADLVDAAGVDTVWLTSSLFNLLIDEDGPGLPCFTGLRQVITGGERLSPPHVARFLDRHPGVTLVNGYGPVESCVFATTHRITMPDCDNPGGIPLGVPVPGTGIHILESAGTVGEICLSGDGLALGYLGAADSAAFAAVEVGGSPVRVYRTGDLGLIDDAGVLHFRGRTDLQVKIAGHRIEPGEVESVARRVPGIRDAAVVPVPAATGGYDRLALFYTAATPAAAAPALVRRVLAAQLPRHLVPHSVHQRPALPMTTTGKLDRGALLASI